MLMVLIYSRLHAGADDCADLQAFRLLILLSYVIVAVQDTLSRGAPARKSIQRHWIMPSLPAEVPRLVLLNASALQQDQGVHRHQNGI